MHVVVSEIKSRPVDRDYAIAQAIAVLISNALAAPAGHLRLAKAETFVMDELERNRFNTERANEIYQFAIDDAVLAWIKEKKLGRAISWDFLRTGLAKKYAIELTEKFKTKGFYK